MNLVIAGIGLIGKRHAEAISKSERANLSAIVDPSAEGKAYSEKRDIPWFEDLPSLFQKIHPDGIILATPTSLHVEQGLLCISHRCPILVEKPISVSVEEGETLTRKAQEAGIPILVGHHRRHNPLIRHAKGVIASGKIGEIRAVHSQCWFYKPDKYFDEAPWRKQEGAGPVAINLVHDIDCIRYLCGEVVSVQAMQVHSLRGYENEDTAAAILALENGSLATVSVSDSIVSPWSWEMTSGEYPVYPPTGKSCYHIGGSHGSLSIPDLNLWHQEERDWWGPLKTEVSPWEHSNPLINQINHFCEVIAGEAEPLISGEEALKTLWVVEEIKSSQKKNPQQIVFSNQKPKR